MNKVRVIDILNKIANGEEVPKKIKYRDKEWEYLSTVLGTGYQYYSNGYQEWKTLQHQVYLEEHLTDEVEIIEEDKEIEKIKIEYSPDTEEWIFYENGDKPNHCILEDVGTKRLIYKINEIIDYLNNKEK